MTLPPSLSNYLAHSFALAIFLNFTFFSASSFILAYAVQCALSENLDSALRQKEQQIC